jgi:signal transduction histidine kinase
MGKQSILVVEDHLLLLEAIRDLLKLEGYEVLTANNGVEALEIMQEVEPSLILSDIMMPKMDGYTLYERVRTNPRWTRIPFIFLTAKGEQKDVLKGKALGVEDYITKPFDTQELAVAVKARLARANAIQRATQSEFEELKRQIVNMLSHELRTPLTYISGYTELALDDVDSLSPDSLQDFLQGIKRGADRLNKLVGDMLLLVQLDTGRAEEEFAMFAHVREDMPSLVRSVVQGHQIYATQEDVSLELQVQGEILPARIYEDFFIDALSRLIDNAIKFSRTEPKEVRVVLRSSSEEVSITVIDRGTGILESDLKNIFQSFRQLDREKLEQQGAGLGLVIARSLIQLHDGEITVESEVGEGSTFTVHLPPAT